MKHISIKDMEYSVKENCVFCFSHIPHHIYRCKWLERMKVGIIDEYRLKIFTQGSVFICVSDSTFV